MAGNLDLPPSPVPRNTLLALAEAALQRSNSPLGATGATEAGHAAAPQPPAQDQFSLSREARQRMATDALNTGAASGAARPTANARAPAPTLPATGVRAPVDRLVAQLLHQLTAPILPLRVLSMQAWTPALVQWLEEATAQAPGLAGDEGLPVLQTWLVQQGVVHTPDGPRGFALTLRLPLAWVEAQARSMPPGPSAGTAGAPTATPLVFGDRAQALPSMPLALVVQNAAAEGPASRTNALLVLEFQPLAQAGVYGREVATPRLDPWVQMALLQASGQLAVEEEQGRRRAQALCDTAACPYVGRASCVQPFCSAMRTVLPVVPAMDSGEGEAA